MNMLGNKEYYGIALDSRYLKYVQLQSNGKKLQLVEAEKATLREELPDPDEEEDTSTSSAQSQEEESLDAESIFGFGESESNDDDEDDATDDTETIDMDVEELDDLDEPDMVSMSEEAEAQINSNAMLLYELMNEWERSRVDATLNLPSGHAIFQTLKERDFKEVKKKELSEIINDRLTSIYGAPKTSDFYAYEVRNDGALILSSTDQESPLIELFDTACDFSNCKGYIHDILPDEVALVGLARANYDFDDDEISALVQFDPKHCRVVFLKGDQIWLVMPMINEGTEAPRFLNTVFSKILFQLDTGEVPGLNRIILCDNTLGDDAVSFFKENFQDLEVENFRFDPEKLEYDEEDLDLLARFTTPIALAWVANGADAKAWPSLSFMPAYVEERQKVFKLQWHGVVLLILIFLTPVVFNYYYQQNVRQINNLEGNLKRTEQLLAQVQPAVNAVNDLSEEISMMQTKLVQLDTLSSGTRKWTTSLDLVNKGFKQVGNSWLISLNNVEAGMRLQGYSLYRNRIHLLASLFDEAVLENVTTEQLREVEVYKFAMTVPRIVKNRDRFNPPKSEELEQLLNMNK